MDAVTTVLLSQGVLGVMVVLETALIWYLLGEVKRLSTKLEDVRTVAEQFRAYLDQPTPQREGKVYSAEDLKGRQRP